MNWLKYMMVVCILLACNIVDSSSAYAASDFDNFPITDNWTIQSNTCPPIDMSHTWGGVVAAQAPSAYAQIVANGTNGGWYVSRSVNTGNDIRSLVVMVVKAENAPSTYTMAHHFGGGGWLGNSGNQWLYTTTEGARASDTFDLLIKLDSSCQPVVENYGAAGSGYSEYSPYQTPEYMGMPDLAGRPFNIRLSMLLAVGDFTAPNGYEGVLIPSVVPLLTSDYVAMGDSFSSGEGNAPFEVGTDEDDVNKCHRSASAYPHWLSQTPSLNLEHASFVACSGATTENVLYGGTTVGAWNESPQVDALSVDTKVVTITIGGNDIGFGDFAIACVVPNGECDSSTTIYDTTMAKIHNVLPGSLVDVLTEIASRTTDAKVYVIGYPYITPSSGLDSLPIQCSYLSSTAGDGRDSLAARDVVSELNTVIGNAVSGFTNSINDTTFTYIDPNASIDGSFDGHDLCQGLDTYFHNVSPDDVFGIGYRQKIFHPNINGQYEYFQIVSGVIGLN